MCHYCSSILQCAFNCPVFYRQWGKYCSLLNDKKQEGAFGNLSESPVSRPWFFELHTGESETQYFKRSVYTHTHTYGLLNIDVLGD